MEIDKIVPISPKTEYKLQDMDYLLIKTLQNLTEAIKKLRHVIQTK